MVIVTSVRAIGMVMTLYRTEFRTVANCHTVIKGTYARFHAAIAHAKYSGAFDFLNDNN